jgi:hypothetical protein
MSILGNTTPNYFNPHTKHSLSNTPFKFLSILLKINPISSFYPLFFTNNATFLIIAAGTYLVIANTGFTLGLFPLPIKANTLQNSS